jgi:signal transduction histidine kinase
LTRDQAHELAMAIKVLCDVRLAATVLMVAAAPVLGLNPGVLAMIAASLGQSYLLLRHWDPLGARLVQGWWFPALESLVAMLLFVSFGSSGLGAAYLGATLALLACAGGWRAMALSLGAFVPIVGMAMGGVFPSLGGEDATQAIWLLSLVVLMVACSLGGFYLRSMIFSRVELIEQRRAAELVEVSSQERLQLARELHDGVSKTLHGCHMIADSLARALATDDHPQTAKARELTRSLEVARQESRGLLQELREEPASDLVPSCGRTVAQWADRNPAVAVDLVLPDEPIMVGVRVRHEALRILGELLENVHRHSGSARVEVGLAVAAGDAVLTVADHGVGMAGADVAAWSRQGHFGLAGVRERAERLGGRCHIDSDATGTRVRVDFPLAGAEKQGVGT